MATRARLILISLLFWPVGLSAADIVTFPSGAITLHGVIYKPEGTGPFPAVVYNRGSAAGMLSKDAFDALGPVFVALGWVLFGPYRRGQGLSASAGPYIGDLIETAKRTGGVSGGAAAMIRLLETDHLDDQLSALAWLRKQPFVEPDRIAVAGTPLVASRLSSAPKRKLLRGGCFSGGRTKLGCCPGIALGYGSCGPKCKNPDLLLPGRE